MPFHLRAASVLLQVGCFLSAACAPVMDHGDASQVMDATVPVDAPRAEDADGSAVLCGAVDQLCGSGPNGRSCCVGFRCVAEDSGVSRCVTTSCRRYNEGCSMHSPCCDGFICKTFMNSSVCVAVP